MDRRRYLALLGAATAAVAGCSGGDEPTTADGTATDTATAEPTETEGEPAEQVTLAFAARRSKPARCAGGTYS